MARTYTNRHRRDNVIRAMCTRFVREKMPRAYALFLAEAERKFRNERPDMNRESRTDCGRRDNYAN
jgi:hypothetical protein